MKRGRKQDDTLPPSRSREIQRAFRQRRSDYIQGLEKRVEELEMEVDQVLRQLGEPARYATLGSSMHETPVNRKKSKCKSKQALPNFMDLQPSPAMMSKVHSAVIEHGGPLVTSRPSTLSGRQILSNFFVDGSYSMHDYELHANQSHSRNASDTYSTDTKPDIVEETCQDFERSHSMSPLPSTRILSGRWESNSQITPSTHSGRSSPFGAVSSLQQPSAMHPDQLASSHGSVTYPGLQATLSQHKPSFVISSGLGLTRNISTHSTQTSRSDSSPRAPMHEARYDYYKSPSDIETSPCYYSSEGLPFPTYPPYTFPSPNDQSCHVSPYKSAQGSPFNCSSGVMLQSATSDCHLNPSGYFEDDESQLHPSEFVYQPGRLQPAFSLLKPSNDLASVSMRSGNDLSQEHPISNEGSSESLSSVTSLNESGQPGGGDQLDYDLCSLGNGLELSPRIPNH
ncbi:uncharacterized protein MELLADRAFT_78895 [Melampsora larici-populina 98AG31]|uniref:BZIP domain-containing protein n=1 Tax=Melampsora larici-populina (strain 98AG31 / pathotype 3-4-7) TaxID=747676 RepID=F4S087_MELLP|nr:uncharacterized protein MELLADRAFT_78895 [Melampsora larici-populina 98AG31]EGG01977.1 hypothetical protein MELLADRAFT_78895 [Melampsora larici-populina 98AG31]